MCHQNFPFIWKFRDVTRLKAITTQFESSDLNITKYVAAVFLYQMIFHFC